MPSVEIRRRTTDRILAQSPSRVEAISLAHSLRTRDGKIQAAREARAFEFDLVESSFDLTIHEIGTFPVAE